MFGSNFVVFEVGRKSEGLEQAGEMGISRTILWQTPQKTQLLWVGKAHFPHFSDDYHTWWLIPVSKWVITLVINGISGGNVHL